MLVLDHIRNDGAVRRKKLQAWEPGRARRGAGFWTYKDLRQRGYPEGEVQVLCANCNMSKQRLGRCAHVVGA